MADDREGSYSGDSFFDDEPSASGREAYQQEEDVISSTFVPIGGDFPPSLREGECSEVSSPPDPAVVSCMSTIEEESRSYETSTAASASNSRRVELGKLASSEEGMEKKSREQEFNVSQDQELQDLQRLLSETEFQQEGQQNRSSSLAARQAEATNKTHDNSTSVVSEDGNIDALLRKLEKLECTQNILEQVLNKGVTDDLDINSILAQIKLADPLALDNNNGDNSQRSFSSEIASIQKIIDGGDLSVSISEVAGGNNLLSPSEPFVYPASATGSNKERAVDDVLKEYEDFERSLSRASAVDESFRSDISSLPPLSTYSNLPEQIQRTVPVIKPPVLKSVVHPTSGSNTPPLTPAGVPVSQMSPAPTRSDQSSSANKNVSHTTDTTPRTKPLVATASSNMKKNSESVPKSTRVEGSHSTSGLQPNASNSYSARPAVSSTAAASKTTSGRELDQNAFKPRNRKSMRSPRTMISPRQPPPESFMDVPTGVSRGGAGEGYQILKKQGMSNTQYTQSENKTEYAISEALKTIEKLNAMVARQETLLDAYTKDNQKLWAQLKESKVESQEKETELQDVINSLKTEVATLKLNRLVASSSISGQYSPRQNSANKAELQRLREESELKSQQLMELRKEMLMLQSKLAEQARSIPKSKPPTIAPVLVQEKEKEYQKQITALNKQVRTLQKILYSKEPTAPPSAPQQNSMIGNNSRSRPLQRTKSDVSKQNNDKQQNLIKNIRNTGVDASGIFLRRPGSSPGINKTVNINTGEVLQASLSCLEQEREEFENIIADKNRLIFEKERVILQLRDEVETLKSQLPEGEVVDHGLIDELRSRIITQNKVIQTLKDHLSSYKKLEGENVLLQEERNILEQHVQDLRRKLDFAQNIGKPENEVLSVLSEKVSELNSRYYHRERQLDTLLNRLTLKTTTGICGGGSSSSSNSNATNLSPRRLPLNQFSNNNGSLGGPLGAGGRSSNALISADILNMAEFSPSNSFHLFNTVSEDLPEM